MNTINMKKEKSVSTIVTMCLPMLVTTGRTQPGYMVFETYVLVNIFFVPTPTVYINNNLIVSH